MTNRDLRRLAAGGAIDLQVWQGEGCPVMQRYQPIINED